MFGPPGRIYIYLIYGMYFMLNMYYVMYFYVIVVVTYTVLA